MIEIAPDILLAIDRSFEEFHRSSNNPGLQYGISYQGRIIHSVSLGERALTPPQPMRRDTISRIASMTKSFACAAVLKLRDKGLVDIDAPLSSIAPKLTLAEPFAGATLRNLMAMRLDLPVDDPWADRLLDAHDSDLEVYFATPMLRAGFGDSTCAYSNISYILLGRIIREICGQPAMDYISNEILTPLTLHDTLWNIPRERHGRMATGYRVEEKPQVAEHHFVCRSDGVVFGGLWSTIDDLAVWLEFLRASEESPSQWDAVLSKASRRELWRRYSSYPTQQERSLITGQPIHSKAHYGFGLVSHTILGVEYISHSGGLPGYGSHMRFHPPSGLAVVALGNGTYCRAASPCASALHHLMLSLEPSLQSRFNTVVEVGYRIADFVLAGGSAEAPEIFAYNVWQDTQLDHFVQQTGRTFEQLGANIQVTSLSCLSGYEGEIVFTGNITSRKLSYTLAPTTPARAQAISWVAPEAV